MEVVFLSSEIRPQDVVAASRVSEMGLGSDKGVNTDTVPGGLIMPGGK